MEINKKKKPRKPCLTAIVLSFLITSEAFADATARDLMSLCGMQGPCADAVVGQLAHDNASSITFSNAAGNDTIPILGVDSSDDTIIRSDAGNKVRINIAEDAQRYFNINATSDTAFSINYGDAGVTAAQNLSILASTSDADDDGSIDIGGGGAISSSRGAYLEVSGNELAGAGDVKIATGNAAGSDAFILLNASGSTLNILDSSSANFLTINQTAGTTGGIQLAAQYGLHMAAYVPTMTTGGVATPAAGTNDFKIGMNAVPTAAAAAAALLPASPSQGDIIEVLNTGPNEVNVCPGSGDTIASAGTTGSANICVGVQTGTKATFVANSTSAWFAVVPIAAGFATPGN